jgi:UDP-N-acetylmuramoyl-tripeptide--D-alanyl-D-alanine ligase
MTFWDADNLRGILGGRWLTRPPAPSLVLAGLATDSRTITPGQVFVALRGQNTDGHRHVPDAARAGAALAIVERLPGGAPAEIPLLGVPDTRRALLKLAAAYRRTLAGTRVVGVAGSNGKTTTVRLIEAVLSPSFRGTASVRSFNNHVGVPATIFAARPGDQYLVCEIGTNAPGEIAELASAVAPDVAVITAIGREHLEGLGSLRGVAEEEASVLEHLRPGGMAIVNADAPHLGELLAGRSLNLVTFGEGEGADLRVGAVEQGPEGLVFTVNRRFRYRLPLLGRHNAANAAAAIGVARRFGMTHDQIAAGLLRVRPPEMRLARTVIAGVTVINDAYNANPDSTAAALRTLAEVGAAAPRRVAVLADMLELGGHSDREHSALLDAALALPIDLLVVAGPAMARAASARPDPRLHALPGLDHGGAERAAAMLRPGDVALLKGSRRMRVERVAEALAAAHAGARRSA